MVPTSVKDFGSPFRRTSVTFVGPGPLLIQLIVTVWPVVQVVPATGLFIEAVAITSEVNKRVTKARTIIDLDSDILCKTINRKVCGMQFF